MPIDWFTVGAQLLNFIILVWLMKRFLYQPVLNAIAAREHKIAAELAAAAASQAKAQQQQQEFEQKNLGFEQQRDSLLRQATDAAKAEGERLLAEGRQAADAASAVRATALQRDSDLLHAEIVRHTQQQVLAIARRVLADLADVSLEQQLCAVFIQRLHGLDATALATLGNALKATSAADPALLRSAFDLPAQQQAAIQAALEERFGQPVALKVETAPELIGGLELSAQGQKLAWTIADYLDQLSLALSPGADGEAGA
ncbi:MAG: F0F1 ATP synthase subunit delta [Gammaproteobacteria bacterium]|nr:F0F1 ATP synthase subunit delta [Gammaproteobacteria bacterium]